MTETKELIKKAEQGNLHDWIELAVISGLANKRFSEDHKTDILAHLIAKNNLPSQCISFLVTYINIERWEIQQALKESNIIVR